MRCRYYVKLFYNESQCEIVQFYTHLEAKMFYENAIEENFYKKVELWAVNVGFPDSLLR